MTAEQSKIKKVLIAQQGKPLSAPEIAKLAGVAPSTARRYLRHLNYAQKVVGWGNKLLERYTLCSKFHRHYQLFWLQEQKAES